MSTELLHRKYRELNTSDEVTATNKRRAARTGEPETPPTKPLERIQTYLDYLQECITIEDPVEREYKLQRIKQVLNDKYVIKPEAIPDSYYESIRERHRQEGYGEIDIPADIKADLATDIVADQRNSLEKWINYLSSDDAKYPMELKYFAVRSILGLGKYDKKKKKFDKRSKGSAAPFPDLNRDALAYVFDGLEKKFTGKKVKFGNDISSEKQEEFKRYLQTDNFAELYAWAVENFNPIPEELLKKTEGKWREYPKGSSPAALVRDIEKYSTGWCIRGEATAARYLKDSDLSVYFSEDEKGAYTIPRLVLVRRSGATRELRGIAEDENHDEYIGEVARVKLAELPDGQLFEKKRTDMKLLTEIEKKMKAKEELTREELIFLYEINLKIKGFGLGSVPRIKKLRDQRHPETDMLIIFDSTADQVAHSREEITTDTKAYIGPLFSGIFQLDLEHVGTSFPDGMVRSMECTIGGKTKVQLKQELKAKKIQISQYAEDMIDSEEFTILENEEEINLKRLTVRDLGFFDGATTDQIFRKALELGLELCPAETGMYLILQNSTLDWMLVAMKQIADRNGQSNLFYLDQDSYGQRLIYPSPDLLDKKWDPDYKFVFRVRPSASLKQTGKEMRKAA
ncbi:MAG: hypothetical protein WC752_03425 [Patescibacteria group bacterium]|jgi:hypothetical protein